MYHTEYFYSKDKLGEAEQGDVVSHYGRLAKSRFSFWEEGKQSFKGRT
jgi:hypothetical protein